MGLLTIGNCTYEQVETNIAYIHMAFRRRFECFAVESCAHPHATSEITHDSSCTGKSHIS
jgi:hypothetical protein